MRHDLLSRVLVFALASFLAFPVAALDPTTLKGAWVGTQESSPLKLALLIEYLAVEGTNQFSGDARFGSTGFRSKELMLSVVRFNGTVEQGRMHVVFMAPWAELRVNSADETLRGVVRYTRTATEREITFERTTPNQAAKAQFNPIPVPKRSEILVMYLGTPDCPACRSWEGTYRDKFLSSALAKSIRFIEVKGASLAVGVRQSDFPEQYRDIAHSLGSGRLGVPQFVIALDKRILVVQYSGWSWGDRVEPLLHQLVAWRSASGH